MTSAERHLSKYPKARRSKIRELEVIDATTAILMAGIKPKRKRPLQRLADFANGLAKKMKARMG